VLWKIWIAVDVFAGFFTKQCPFWITFDILIFAEPTEERYSTITKLSHRSQQGRLGTNLLSAGGDLVCCRNSHGFPRRAMR
jgi:hypothetical protein